MIGLRMLRDIVRFHCTLQRHFLGINGINYNADRPLIV